MAGKGLWRFAIHDKTPLGITILLTFSAGFGTYLVTPSINRAIQRDNARSEHIVKAIDQMNSDMIELSENIREYNYSPPKCTASDRNRIASKSMNKVAAMQWRLVDASALSLNDNEKKHVNQFGLSLAELQKGLSDNCASPIKTELLSAVSQSGFVVLSDLYHDAGIQAPMEK